MSGVRNLRKINIHITQERRKQLACILKLTERNIKVWFHNRRIDSKKAVHSTSEMVALGPELGNAAFDQWNCPGVPGPSAHQHYAGNPKPFFALKSCDDTDEHIGAHKWNRVLGRDASRPLRIANDSARCVA
ncbi:hypothetical protein ACJJTC_007914 [Scirpophaga incertulas]